LRFAEQGAVLLAGFIGVQVEASATGLILKSAAERDLLAAATLVEAAIPTLKIGAVEVVYLNQNTMEPYLRVRVTTPADNYGDVIGQFIARVGSIEGCEDLSDRRKLVSAEAPAVEMLGFDQVLAALTLNRALAEYHCIGYRPVHRQTLPPPRAPAARA
jgi:translation elongation factor EF-G